MKGYKFRGFEYLVVDSLILAFCIVAVLIRRITGDGDISRIIPCLIGSFLGSLPFILPSFVKVRRMSEEEYDKYIKGCRMENDERIKTVRMKAASVALIAGSVICFGVALVTCFLDMVAFSLYNLGLGLVFSIIYLVSFIIFNKKM